MAHTRKRIVLTQLAPGSETPTGEPRRHSDSQGYIRLRWTVAPYRQVEVKEHRVFEGRVLPSRIHVHHINGVKSDNRPENLMFVSQSEHTKIHHPMTWDLQEAYAFYDAGRSLPWLSKQYGKHTATILRAFKRAGLTVRSISEAWQYRADKVMVDERRVLALLRRGTRVSAIASRLGVGRHAIEVIRVKHDIPAFPVGSPKRIIKGE